MADETDAILNFLDQAHQSWLENPPHQNSPQRTLKYQEAVHGFLLSQGFTDRNLHLEYKVSALFDKNYDLVYAPFDIPRLAISFKIIPLHELSAHGRTRLEEASGDAFNIHRQFADLVLGFVWVLQIDPEKKVDAGDWRNLQQGLLFLSRLTGRPNQDSEPSRYEGIGIYPCSLSKTRPSTEHSEIVKSVAAQVPKVLTPPAMAGLLLTNYRMRFGELHEE